MGESCRTIDLRSNVELRSRVHEEDRRIEVDLCEPGQDQLTLVMTEGGACALVEEIEVRLPALTGEPTICPDCRGTGDLWIPVAPGAVTQMDCPCDSVP